ncbi:MAG: transcriptional repressor [Deltaproteobacteria bacterium]|nr:transcriptional repressor [Deltaproteobacteria bacterium]MBW2051276.1 transcriptional repressor [Deltaproteobacteria bacterium]MBW2139914.1 transcriptional repressor [Deltaproteobacteria bacterium]MBW2322379.1 transcriptional repressor [Deltaproteobacteria bacterium]
MEGAIALKKKIDEVSMKDEIQILRELLKKRGMRNTPEREAIIEAIFSKPDHFDVDELYLRMKEKTGVSKASIYRTIPLLIEAGLIDEVFHEDGHMHYERAYGSEHHCHLRCSKCRKIIEFYDKRISEIEKEVGEKFDFAIEGHRLEVFGLCSDCATIGVDKKT